MFSNKEKTLIMMGINCKGINKKEFVEYWKKEFGPLLEKKINELKEKRCNDYKNNTQR